MKIDEILHQYVNQDNVERKLGRYWASDIYGILKGYVTPENFFTKKPIDMYGVRMILTGKANELMLEKILTEMKIDFEPQVKKEIQLTDEIVLVIKPDFVFKDFIVETKYPFSPFQEIPPRYNFQLECYYRGFYLPVYLGKFSSPFNLEFIEYVPSKRRWTRIKKVLMDFHEKLKQRSKYQIKH